MNQTAWIQRLFPQGGYYLEAGAHDGVGDSNTYPLEQLGTWQGLCVEPSSAYAGLVANRKCRTDERCLWNFDGVTVPFCEVAGDSVELSGIPVCFGDHWDRRSFPHRVTQRTTVTLPTLLAEHQAPRVIEYLCLDTEGSELTILQAHDFDRYRILALTVEHNRVTDRREALRAFLATKGFVRDEANPWDVEDWFVHASVRA